MELNQWKRGPNDVYCRCKVMQKNSEGASQPARVRAVFPSSWSDSRVDKESEEMKWRKRRKRRERKEMIRMR